MSPSLQVWELGLRGPRSHLLVGSLTHRHPPRLLGRRSGAHSGWTARSVGPVGCGGGVLRVEDLRGREKPTGEGGRWDSKLHKVGNSPPSQASTVPGRVPRDQGSTWQPRTRVYPPWALQTGEPWTPTTMGAQRRGSQGWSTLGKQREPSRGSPSIWGLLGRRTGGSSRGKEGKEEAPLRALGLGEEWGETQRTLWGAP